MATADALIESLQGIEASGFANEAERIRARDALFEALRKVQSPWDIAWDHNWVNPAVNAAIKALIDAGVFRQWAAKAGGQPATAAQLADLTGTDPVLIRRLLHTVAGQNLVVETAEDTYARTPWAANLADDPSFPSLYGGFYAELNDPSFRTLPYFLKETGFKNPTDIKNANFQYWQGPGSDFFQYVGTNARLTSDFNNAMECHSRYNLSPWVDLYPTDAIAAAAKERPGKPVMVDVGGGKGHDLLKFQARHPDTPASSLILQDLPDILKGLPANDAITVQPHDFFTPQPESARGARVYFMHNVLHDWPNPTATEILKNIAAAMEKGYSTLLIHESLVSNVKPLARVCVSDMVMMSLFGASERTETEWTQLIEGAGLRVVKIWKPLASVESVIEVQL